MKLSKLLILLLLLSLSAHSKTIVIPVPPTFGNPGPITICINGSYYLNPSTTNGTFSTLSATIATVNASGYVTGVSEGTTTVSLVTEGGTVTATVTVAATSTLPAITDGLASYKFNNNPQGPIGSGNVNYVGYNGKVYFSQTRPIKTGFYKANNQSGNSAGSPTEFYIFRCTTCGTVSEYATRPQGTLSGNTNGTGQLTYTSSNGGGPFTIIYQATGGSPVTVNNISSTVAFNVVTPTITTSYKLISVTDENTKASTDFSGIAASITVPPPHYVGESFGGGIVFYVDGTGQHGLIAATSDQGSIKWYNTGYSTTGAIGTAIGTGFANTNTIINSQGGTVTSYAAGLARAYTDGVYHDWYLPSKDELTELHNNRNIFSGINNGFANDFYWSSSEINTSDAWCQGFYPGGPSAMGWKPDKSYVRAIRSF